MNERVALIQKEKAAASVESDVSVIRFFPSLETQLPQCVIDCSLNSARLNLILSLLNEGYYGHVHVCGTTQP